MSRRFLRWRRPPPVDRLAGGLITLRSRTTRTVGRRPSSLNPQKAGRLHNVDAHSCFIRAPFAQSHSEVLYHQHIDLSARLGFVLTKSAIPSLSRERGTVGRGQPSFAVPSAIQAPLRVPAVPGSARPHRTAVKHIGLFRFRRGALLGQQQRLATS
jgi:hypothetical protein